MIVTGAGRPAFHGLNINLFKHAHCEETAREERRKKKKIAKRMPSHPLTTCLNTIMSATGKLGEHCVTLNSSFIAQINYKDIQQIKH